MSLSGSSNQHARLAPSASKTWTSCTASVSYASENEHRIFPIKVREVVKLTPYLLSIPEDEVFDYEWRAIDLAQRITSAQLDIEDLTDEQKNDIWKSAGSEAAREGTRAHEFAAAILLGQKTLSDIPEDFRRPVGLYVDQCNATPGERFIEARETLFYSENPDDKGTCDFCAITSERVVIRDLKYGAGVLVDAFENEQLAIYALSFMVAMDPLYDFGPETMIEMHICQPRHREAEGSQPWIVTYADLQAFCRDIHYKAIQIRENRGIKFEPSVDACRWCDCKLFCEARSKAATDVFDFGGKSGVDLLADLPDLTKEEKKELSAEQRIARVGEGFWTDERMVAVWKNTKLIISLLEDLDEILDARAQMGDTFGDAVKLVSGREGNTKWADEAAAETFLKGQGLKQEDRFKFDLISPTQAKKLLAEKLESSTRTANRFASLVTRSAGKPVVALASDKRPALAAAVDLLPDLSGGLTDDEM